MFCPQTVEAVEDDELDVIVRLLVDEFSECSGSSCSELGQDLWRTFDSGRVLSQCCQARGGFVFDRVGWRCQQLRNTPDPFGLEVSAQDYI